MFNQIQYFISVVKNHNFTKAAEECHISQPAISQQIKELEGNLGVKLLDRKGRSFKVTPAGQYFYQHGQDIIKNLDELLRQTKEIGTQEKEPYVLRAGYLRNFGTSEFLEAVSKFSKEYPDVQVRITSSGHENLYDLLRTDRIDFAFSDLRRAPSNSYVNDFLTESHFQVIISNNKFPTDQKTITTDDLKDMPCILIVGPNEEAAEEDYYRNILGVRSTFITAQTYDEAAVMAASGQGYLLMNDRTSKLIAHQDALQTMTLLNNGKEMTQDYYAFWKANNSGFYIETFADILKEQFEK
ncbi:LysR family transcriptional regulator [Lactobacillus hamsteri]|nr:LysR family transcriptional regulator [Lactobacillus hamsteri]